MGLRAVAEVNLAAIERNVARLRDRLGPGVALCAVVKARGYGHGASEAARAAQAAGARWLAVATAEEASELRAASVSGPILVMGALTAQELPVALAAGADVVAWDARFVELIAREGRRRISSGQTSGRPGAGPIGVHVKLDSGMGRLGTRDRTQALEAARAIVRAPELQLAGAMTHFATADEDLEFAHRQLQAFEPFRQAVVALTPDRPIVHAANSAATLQLPASHFDMVRCGIAIYGSDPMNEDPERHGLEPALSLTSYVAALKPVAPGESAGYGRRFIAKVPTNLATLPIGYGDGVPRRLTNNCDVLIGGGRYRLVGTVSMDNVTVDVGPEPAVELGTRAVLIGRDGAERQTAEDLARRLGTISYEVLCGISCRVPRRYHRDTAPAA